MRVLGIRYVLRKAAIPGFWMVWDRDRRGDGLTIRYRCSRQELSAPPAGRVIVAVTKEFEIVVPTI